MGLKRAGGDTGGDIARIMIHICQRLHVAHREVRFQCQRLPGSGTHHQMGFHIGNVTQNLQQAHAVNCPLAPEIPMMSRFMCNSPYLLRADFAGNYGELQARVQVAPLLASKH